MSSKRKLIILMLVLSFVLLSIIATVAVLFALTQQTIKTSLNMVYNVEDVDGEVRASYTIGETTTYLTPKADANHIGDDGNSLIFKAEDVENAGTLEFPTEKLNLTSENSIIVIQYTYKNNGGKTFAATMNPILTVNDNMNIRYGIYDEVTGTIKYSTQTYALIVPENGTLSYWIEISIKDLSRNANLEGSFEWDVLGVDKDTLGYESLTLVDFVTDENGNCSAAVKSGTAQGTFIGEITFPEEVNGFPVTKIVQGSSAIRSQVSKINIPASVTSIEENAFYGFANLEEVVFLQDASVSSAALLNGGLVNIGKMAFYLCTSLDSIQIPNTVTSLGIGCFYGCSDLVNVTIPNSVTSLGTSTFAGCTSLRNVIMSQNTTQIPTQTFDGCTSLLTIENIENITSIGVYALRKCTSLKEITLPESLTTIGKNALTGCTSLEKIIYKSSSLTSSYFGVTDYQPFSNAGTDDLVIEIKSTTLPNDVFYKSKVKTVIIDEGLTAISASAFQSCTNLTTINIPNSVKSIGNYAFASCSKLTDITICSSSAMSAVASLCKSNAEMNLTFDIEDVNTSEFYDNDNIASLTFTSKVKRISSAAFYQCKGLKTVTFAEGIETLAGQTFQYCTGLTSVVIPNSLTTLGGRDFQGCSNLESVTLGSGLTAVYDYTFADCSNLTSIVIPRGVEYVKNSAFYNCGLTSVTFESGSNLFEIGGYAFAKNSNLTSISLPSGLVRLRSYAFQDCGITSVVIPANVTIIGKGCFLATDAANDKIQTITILGNKDGWYVGESSESTAAEAESALSASDMESVNLIAVMKNFRNYHIIKEPVE